MQVKCTLIVSDGGGVRVTKRHPMQIGWDEIAIPLTVDIPDGWFVHSAPVVAIAVPEPSRLDIPVEVGEVQP